MTFETAFILFLVAVVVSRIISRQALKELSSEEKAALLDAFSGMQAYSLVPLIVLLALYFGLFQFTSVSVFAITVGYFALLVAYAIWSYWFTRRKLATLDLPDSYLRKHGMARTIQYVGLGVFFAVAISAGI